MDIEQVLATQMAWQEMLIMSVLGGLLVMLAGMIAIRAGRAPFWGLLMLIPFVQIIAVWIFAFIPWSRVDTKDD